MGPWGGHLRGGNPCPSPVLGAEVLSSSEGTVLAAQGCSWFSSQPEGPPGMHLFSQKSATQAALGHLPRERPAQGEALIPDSAET